MNNYKELQKQIENIHVQIHNKTKRDMMPVLKEYKKTLNYIRGELGKIYSRYSTDGKLGVGFADKYNVLRNMDIKLRSMGEELGEIDEANTTKILKEVYKEGYFKTSQVIQKGVDVALDFKLIKPEMIESALKTPMEGKMYSDRIWENKTKLINNLRQEIKQGMEQGYDIAKLSKNISNTMGSSAYNSMRLVNTEVTRVVNAAQSKIYKDSGVVNKVMWSATLEDSTCDDCGSMDGQTFDLDNAPDLPMHPNCRCCLIPYIDGWSPTSRYNNQEEGESQDYKTYEEWAKNKDN